MDADSSINDWSSDDASESQPCDFADSEDEHSQQLTLTRRSQLRPAGNGLAFVPYADWRPGRSYNQQPAENIWYDVEWKLSVNNRRKTGESEPGIALSPRQFWKYVLQPKLQAVMKSAKSPLTASDTQILLSVSDRKTSSITKRFSKLDINWLFVAKQLQEWSRFLTDDKRTKAGQLPQCAGPMPLKVQREARISAERAVLGRPESWRQVIALVRCPGPPCNKGPYCWRDGQTHYKLLSHHLKMLVDEVQKGHSMQTHNDIPEHIREELHAEQQQQAEREHKRRRRDSDSCPTGFPVIHIHNAPSNANAGASSSILSTPEMVFPTSPTFDIQGSREDAVKAYVVWQCSKVSSQEQKSSYDLAQSLTLDHGLCLYMVYTNQRSLIESRVGSLQTHG
ncbi:uncharacterized protein TRIVIDRAFT_68184 [Trichoderma virens Gv29-8]|uniref:Uncharacterized protein n=1 Tax=Hypocrea virens (strain Gv29-8 / FGSC 10586) TaxID=413071 RepID=G9N0E6_HYPVG|nr:uncharacterized protein TRIVIDRAFT_68184 [Trichoderma virens Gv29-8]EHK19828.1 hypothetical protein TRIVIDRAFT_68184 [Trichoderma virens Gv29-8]